MIIGNPTPERSTLSRFRKPSAFGTRQDDRSKRMKVLISVCCVVTACLILGDNKILTAQPGLPTNLKAPTYRVLVLAGANSREATGFMMNDGKYTFLLLNHHTVRADSGSTIDSLLIFKNHTVENGEVVSGPEHWVAYTNRNGQDYLFESEIDSVDLILLSLGPNNSTIAGIDSVFTLPVDVLNEKSRLLRLNGNSVVVTLIGYPGKGGLLLTRTPEYIWGDLVKIDKYHVLSSAPSIHGFSGSPIFGRHNGKYVFLGIHRATARYGAERVAVGVPAWKIREAFTRFFK